MKLEIQVYGQTHLIPLTKGLRIQCGQHAEAEIWEDLPSDREWIHEELTNHCLGNGTIFTLGEWHFVSLHINCWRFIDDVEEVVAAPKKGPTIGFTRDSIPQ